MRTSRSPLICSLLAAVTLGACTAADSAPAFTAADSTAVAATIEKWRTTILARDFDGWGTTVSQDVVLHPPNLKAIVGHTAAVDYIKAYPEITKFEITVHEQVGRGDVAYSRGSFSLDVKLPDGTAASDTGSFLSVFKRQADGAWPHDRVMWNSNLPVPTPPPAAPRR